MTLSLKGTIREIQAQFRMLLKLEKGGKLK